MTFNWYILIISHFAPTSPWNLHVEVTSCRVGAWEPPTSRPLNAWDDGHLTRRFPHDLSTQLIRRVDVLDTALFGISQFAMEGISPFSSMINIRINMIPSGNLLHSY